MAAIAVDTNVLVRLATGDSRSEHAAAEALVAGSAIFVSSTVLLETEWVLRSRYGYSPEQFVDYARWLLQGPDIEFGDRKLVIGALDLHVDGFDFADAMHLLGAAGREFATFDRSLLRRARAHRLPARTVRGKTS